MTLDEAIKHTEEVAEGYEKKLKVYENIDEDRPLFTEEETECRLCAEEHRQLAEWLKELKAHREAWSKLKNDVVVYHNNYNYDTAMHFLNIIDTRLSEIGVAQNENNG